MSNDSNGDSPTGLRLGRFERNLFFHGKLMTARDMEVEQAYHADRLDAVARNVLGEGIVTGLETTVTEENTDLRVQVEPGVALDGEGRVVVVEETDDDLRIAGGAVEEDAVSIFLHYADCKRETVPVANSGDGCTAECTYNRVREGYRLTYRSGPPTEGQKPIPGDAIVFPTPDDAALDEVDRPDPDAVGLHHVAQSYNDSGAGTSDPTGQSTSGTVFLGCFEPPESDDSNWERRPDDHRPYVYTNDMLYAAVAEHAADFDNPHEVTAAQLDAITSVDGVGNPGGDVDLRSDDGSITIDRADGVDAPHVDFALDRALQDDIEAHGNRLDDHGDRLDDHRDRLDDHGDQLDDHGDRLDDHGDRLDDHDGRLDAHDRRLDDHGDRLDAHDRRLFYHTWLERSRALKFQVESFYDVVKTFPEAEAGTVAAKLAAYSAEALRETSVPVERDNARDLSLYVRFLREVADLAAQILGSLKELDGLAEQSVERYALAVKRFRSLLASPPEDGDRESPTVEYVLQLLVAQTSVCEAARLLATAEEEPIRLPGGFEIPKGLVNRPLRTSAELRVPTAEDEDDPVLDPPVIDLPVDPREDPPVLDPDLPFEPAPYPDVTLPGDDGSDESEDDESEDDGSGDDGPVLDDPVVTDPIIDDPRLDRRLDTDGPTADDSDDDGSDDRDGGSTDSGDDSGSTDSGDDGSDDGTPAVDGPIIDKPVIDGRLDVLDRPDADVSTLADALPDLTGEPAESVSTLAADADAEVEFRTPEGETVDPERAKGHVVVDQPSGQEDGDDAPTLSFTVVEPQSTDVLPGIGSQRAKQLVDAGYPSVEALSKADPEELSGAMTRVSVGMAEEWIEQAGAHVKRRR